MKNLRVISRLDIKGSNVIKGIQFEALRVIGNPQDLARKYYNDGIDEIIYVDTVANLYNRSKIVDIVYEASRNIGIPLTAGGGVRTLKDIEELLNAGADKVFINTQATKNPRFIEGAAKIFGSQCIVLSVEAKNLKKNKWEAYTDSGREPSGLDVIDWIKKGENLGAGEIFLTSIDKDGTKKGFDIELIKEVSKKTSLSLVVSGGYGDIQHLNELTNIKNINGVAIGSAFHYEKSTIQEAKKFLKNNFVIRKVNNKKSKNNTDESSALDLKADYNKYSFRQMRDASLKVKNQKESLFKIKKKKKFKIGVINYGINNLQSVVNALNKIKARASWINTPEEIMNSEKIILPGIGAFGEGMKGLKKNNLVNALKKKVNEGTPILGICLGMQLLFSESFEFGKFKGLNFIKGKVISLKKNKDIKIPHIGWSQIKINNKLNQNILKNFNNNENYFYFVHSYMAVPSNKKIISSETYYGKNKICSSIQHKNIFGTQFHPEKSGELGARVLKNFVDIKF